MSQRLSTRIATLSRDIDALDADLAHELGFSNQGLRVLDQLYIRDGQNASDLARASSIVPTSFTPLLDRLERAGLICRRAHPKDRRAVQIFLTPQGKALKKQVIDHMENVEAEIKHVLMSRVNKPMPSDFLETFFAPLPTGEPF